MVQSCSRFLQEKSLVIKYAFQSCQLIPLWYCNLPVTTLSVPTRFAFHKLQLRSRQVDPAELKPTNEATT